MDRYQGIPIREIRRLCAEKGVDHKRKSRQELIDELRVVEEQEFESDTDDGETGSRGNNVQRETLMDDRAYQLEIKKVELEAQKVQLERVRLEMAARTPDDRRSSNGQFLERPINSYGEIIRKFNETSDQMDDYLHEFEKTATVMNIPKEKWNAILIPRLNHRAASVIHSMPTEDLCSFDRLKDNLLREYHITHEKCRYSFRTAYKGKHQTYKQFGVRLTDLLDKWLAGAKVDGDFGKLKDLILLEQFYETLSDPICIYVRDRSPQGFAEAVSLSDRYIEARERQGHHGYQKPQPGKNFPSQVKKPNPKEGGYTKQRSGTGDVMEAEPTIRCFVCSRVGHKSFQCKEKGKKNNQGMHGHQGDDREFYPKDRAGTSKQTGNTFREKSPTMLCSTSKSVWARTDSLFAPYMGQATVGDKTLCTLRDTGSSVSLIERSSVPDGTFTGEKITIFPVTGEKHEVDLAKITVVVDGESRMHKFAVVSNLPWDLILGNDWNSQTEEPRKRITRDTEAESDESDRNMTTGKNGEPQEGTETEIHGEECGILTRSMSKVLGKNSQEREDYRDEGENVVEHQPEERKRWGTDEQEGRTQSANEVGELEDDTSVRFTTSEFIQAQKNDPTLNSIREKLKCASQDEDATSRFVMENELLKRVHQKKGTGDEIKQLVVPAGCRKRILELAHDLPISGHLGVTKTADRIFKNFYWPGVCKDVRDYVNTCPECQFVRKKGDHAPSKLQPLPVIAEPFSRVSVDLVGPLPTTESGNKHIVVVIDHASRFPDARPLHSIESEEVVSALIDIFSHVGFPREILSDRGKQFTCKLTQELWSHLGVQPIFSSAYHPMTNGLVERFNGTLKSLLKRVSQENPENWDKMLPYVLFGCREVPQASTGLSPFELIFGHNVRGPLDLLRGQVDKTEEQATEVLEYVDKVNRSLEKGLDLAQKNLTQAKIKQATWYDKKARVRELSVGDEVLVLTPNRKRAMEVEWEGPYTVLRRKAENTYEVDVGEDTLCPRTYHINMMKKYYRRQEVVNGVWSVGEREEDCELRVPDLPRNENRGDDEGMELGENLTECQRSDLSKMLKDFRDILTDKPGRTQVLEHDIELTDETPIKCKPYRVSREKKELIDQEIKTMLDMGIIEESKSPFAAPVVLVPKKNGTMRFCVNYKALNSVTKGDAFPTPNIEELVNGLHTCDYLTKLDLSKGYWQVNLTDRAKERSAFTTTDQLYQFVVMSFGLKNAPATFIRLMTKLLKGTEHFAKCYVDDVLIFSGTWEQHLRHVREVLTRLAAAGLTVNPQKSEFGNARVDYLGFHVGPKGISPEEARVEIIRTWPRPMTKKDIRAFLGITGYYRKSIPQYAEISSALAERLKKKEPEVVQWTEECQLAFEALKTKLRDREILKCFDPEKETYVQTDASNVGIGAVLSQRDASGEEHPVAYLSRKLTETETRYSTIERETLAVVWAVDKLKPYLGSRPFTIISDHNPLVWLDHIKDKNRKLMRWSLYLQEYNFTVQYKPGTKHGNADGLSRRCS